METQIYTESELQAKKYGELLKIAKTLKLKGGRIKTSKLIENILECQALESDCLEDEASAVVAALNESLNSKEKECKSDVKANDDEVESLLLPSDDLLSSIQFPVDLESSDDIKAKDFNKDCEQNEGKTRSKKPMHETKTRTRGKRKYQSITDLPNVTSDVSEEGNSTAHRRSDTYDVDAVPSESKRQRTCTFEKETTDDSKHQRSGTYEKDTTDDSKHQRSGTYEKEIPDDSKHKRSGTYETDQSAKPSISKRRRTSTFEVKSTQENDSSVDIDKDMLQENSEQLEALTKRISMGKEQNQSSPASLIDDAQTRLRRSSSFVIEKPGVQTPTSETGSMKSASKSVPKTPRTLRKSISNVISAKKNSTRKSTLTKAETPEIQKRNTATPKSQKKNVATPKSQKKNVATPKSQKKNTAAPKSQKKTATPKSQKKTTSMPKSQKKTLSPKIVKPLFNVGRGDSTNKDGSKSNAASTSIPRFVTFARKLKMPNFAKIHEKAFNRMEALDDYVDKKRKMGDLPNSEQKKKRPVPSSEEVFKPQVTNVKNLDLNFAAKNSPARLEKTPGKDKVATAKSPKLSSKKSAMTKSAKKSPKTTVKPTFGKLKSPKVLANKSPKSAAVKPTFGKLKSPKVLANKTPKSVTVKPSLGKLKSPKVMSKKTVNALSRSKISESTIGSARKSVGAASKVSSAKKLSPKARFSTLPIPRKENIHPGRASIASPAPSKQGDISILTPGSIHKRKEYNPKASISKPLSYVPYKGALKPVNKVDARKAMSEKLPTVKTTKERRDDQRKLLKGVRFNKRFELQMANRGINLN